jgi:5-methylcytosine-specific restriction endonuclease McrA
MRPQCMACNQRPRAVAYHRADSIQYRRLCEHCIRRGKRIKPPVPRWQSSGYKKKPTCDRCGFKSKYSSQLVVHHIDGNQNNTSLRNLKTVCQNCMIEVAKLDLPWRAGDLEPDV